MFRELRIVFADRTPVAGEKKKNGFSNEVLYDSMNSQLKSINLSIDLLREKKIHSRWEKIRNRG